MTVYESGFVLMVSVNGQTQKEENGKVCIPFGSEYKIRLRNKNDRDAVVKLFIDGANVTGKDDGFIVRANSTMDIERYVDNIDIGLKFRFVKLSDGRVGDKGEPENGCIEAKFYLAKKKPEPVIVKHIHHHDYWYYHPYQWPYYTMTTTGDSDTIYYNDVCGDTVDLNNISLGSSNNEIGESSLKCNWNFQMPSNEPFTSLLKKKEQGEDGATVKGGKSSQQFANANIGETEDEPVTLKLTLKGIKGSNVERRGYCRKCGHLEVEYGKFCPRCGTKY